MTVDQLIEVLRQHPGDAVVGIYDHDEASHFAVFSVEPLTGTEAWGPLTDREQAPAQALALKY